MARKLRKKRVAAAVLILALLIGGISFAVFKACGRDKGGSTGGGGANNVTQQTTGSGTVTTGGESEQTTASTVATPQWPAQLSSHIKEYTGAGEIVSSVSGQDDEGRAMYTIRYKGTTIDSCFAYSKDTLGIGGEWTEVITEELYTMSRETESYILQLSCKPKAEDGYDLEIKVTLKK